MPLTDILSSIGSKLLSFISSLFQYCWIFIWNNLFFRFVFCWHVQSGFKKNFRGSYRIYAHLSFQAIWLSQRNMSALYSLSKILIWLNRSKTAPKIIIFSSQKARVRSFIFYSWEDCDYPESSSYWLLVKVLVFSDLGQIALY